MRILIVDDNATNLKLLTQLVTKMPGCIPLAFSAPDAALAAMPDIDFDVAIIDYIMPVYNGVELVTEIVRFDKYVGKPIIFVTADLDLTTRLEALDAGAIDFMTKPINPVEFQVRVQNIVDLAIAREELANNPDGGSRDAEVEIIQRMIMAAGYKDPQTMRRQMRIAGFSYAIACTYGLSQAECEDIRLVAPIQSAGKIAVPDAQMLKQGRLTEAAFNTMQRHVTLDPVGEGRTSLLKLACDVAASHRERWDGQGFPLRLKGESIPLVGRLVAIADNFDALTTERPFKSAWTVEEAAAHIRKRAGQHFDPECVEAFERALPELRAIMRQEYTHSPVMAQAG